MSLKIFYGDRIETLAADLKRRLLADRSQGDPFAFSQVVVPNANIAKWLRLRAFAAAPELCMGLEFPFIEQRLFGLLSDRLPDGERPQLLPMNAYANGIMAILLRDRDPLLAPFRRYIADGDDGPLVVNSRSRARMAWQLAQKLADLMDKYEVRRGRIVDTWLDESVPLPNDPTEAAEAALARKLFGDGGVYPPTGDKLSLRQLFERARSAKGGRGGKPERVYVFGLSTLSSLQVKILHWLARTCEITVYHVNVCREYWGDRDALQNSLLRVWGTAGRETIRMLVDLEESNGGADAPIDMEWTEICTDGEDRPETMLGMVQSAIRDDSDGEGLRRVDRQDASIQVVGAPGVRREVEMVYNAILGAVWKPDGSGSRPWSDCTFSDIAVLVPDMKTYRPAIEAVFDARGQIPYGLIDTSASEDSCYLHGFLALMDLARDGLCRDTLFAVLGNACVQKALGFSADDVGEWRRCAEKIGAFDGFDPTGPYGKFSWDSALARMRLGMVANDSKDMAVWQGGDESSLKFSEIVEKLYRELAPLAKQTLACTPACAAAADTAHGRNWVDVLRRVADEFLAVERDDLLEDGVRRRLFQTLGALDAIEGRQGLDLVAEAAEEFVGGIKCQSGGYLTLGVTVAGLQPMRPVPFKQVFVLGMGEGVFPGRDGESTLEIRGAGRTLGDTRPTEVNRYLFLETLMATRERLVVTYPCLDVEKDAELFPSGMVRELEGFAESAVLPEGVRFKEAKLPLLERGDGGEAECPVGDICWDADSCHAGLFTTYSNVERRIARRLAGEEGRDAARADAEVAATTGGTAHGVRQPVTAKELADFLKGPMRSVLRHRHGIAVDGYMDDDISPDSPVDIPGGPVLWNFQKDVLSAIQDGAGPDEIRAIVKNVYDALANHGQAPAPESMLGGCAAKDAEASLMDKDGATSRLSATRDFLAGFLSGGGDFRAVAYGRTGDEVRKDGVRKAKLPPKAALEQLMAFLMAVASEREASPRELRVGVIDMGNMTSGEWVWRVSPDEARQYVASLTKACLGYLDAPGADGMYLDYGYSDLADAIAKSGGRLAHGIPLDEEDWTVVMRNMTSDKSRKGGGPSFNNDLVVEKSVGAWLRKPDEGDVRKIIDDWDARFKLPMSGERVDCETEEA